MLGSTCSPCCNANPCNQCTEGELPETLTVTFSGLADEAPGPDLISLGFTSCLGSGAEAEVNGPVGRQITGAGPIADIVVTDGGTGYARLGRVAPTLAISGGSGTGATFTPTFLASQDGCDLDLWSIETISVSGGSGYENEDELVIEPATGDTEVAAATAILHIDKVAPDLTLDGTATTAVNVAQIGDGNWLVASVTVTDGGSGYTDFESLTFDLGVDDVEVTAATAVARVVFGEPENPIQNELSAGGSGAVITPTWQLVDASLWPGAVNEKTYRVSAVTITDGGTGYAVDDVIDFSFDSDADGFLFEGQPLTVLEVDGGGAITEIGIAEGGLVIGAPTDQLESVAIVTPGSYYKDDPGSISVYVNAGGTYYREDASVAPYVADVTVEIGQTFPSNGTGAALSVVIDDDTASETFGQITAVTIGTGGDGYLANELLDTCLSRFDGREVVVQRDPTEPCVYRFQCAQTQCSLEYEQLAINYNGPSSPLTIELATNIFGFFNLPGSPESATMTADDSITNCSEIDVTATGGVGVPEGATAHVVAGGEYVETETCLRLPTDEDMQSLAMEVEWGGRTLDESEAGSFCDRTPSLLEAAVQVFDLGDAEAVDCAGLFTGSGNYVGCSVRYQVIGNSGVDIREKGCGWVYGGHIVVRKRWGGDAPSGPGGFFVNCVWTYPIFDMELDDEGFPAGEVVLGNPVFELDQNTGEDVSSLCDDPGIPTVTLSMLP
jgi:hypothetical protein